jgi:hypothetical protein
VIASRVVDEIERLPSFEECTGFPEMTEARYQENAAWLWKVADRSDRDDPQGRGSVRISSHFARYLSMLLLNRLTNGVER